jgi:hypothetical protein
MAGSLASYCSRKVRISNIYFTMIQPITPTAMIPNTPSEPSGSWDSIHVFEASERGRQAHYKLTSTIMLQLVTHKGAESDATDGQDRRGAGVGAEGHGKGKSEGWKKEGEVSLSGSMTRQVRLCSPFRVGVLAK